MASFKAIVVDKTRNRPDGRAHRFRREGFDGRRRHRPRRIFDGELQRRPRRHRQGAGGAPLPDDRGRRFRRHRGSLVASGLEGRRQSHPQRLGARRDPSRRLCAEGARQRRLAGPAAGEYERARRHGDRHGGLHRDALGHGAGARRARAQKRPGDRDRRRGRRRLRRHRASRQARLRGRGLDRPAGGGGLSQGARRRPRSSSARNWPGRCGRSARNAGPAASTPWARPRSPMCCR